MRTIKFTSNFRKSRPFATSTIPSPPLNVGTVVFNLYDTLLFPKTGLLPFDIQAIITTYKKIGWQSANQKDFIKIIKKYEACAPEQQVYKILYDKYMESYRISDYKHIEQLYNMFALAQKSLLDNPDYYLGDRYLNKTIKLLRNQSVKNFAAISKYDWKTTAILENSLELNQDISLQKIIYDFDYDSNLCDIFNPSTVTNNLNNLHNLNKVRNFFAKYKDSGKILYISNSESDIKYMRKLNIAELYLVGLTSYTSPHDFYLAGADYSIDHIGQLPYIVSKLNSTF
jgi:hypothetical protein